MARAVAILRALLSKGGWAGFDPSALLKKLVFKWVRRFLLLRFHPDKNIGNIQAAQADFVKLKKALGTIKSAEKAELVPALVVWKKSLKQAADGTFSRLIVFVFVPACSPSIAICESIHHARSL